MAVLTPISGCGAKGPACFLVETSDARVLLDLGYGPQPGLWPDVSRVGNVDALLISHSHQDHAGGLKLLPQVGNPAIHASQIVCGVLPGGLDATPLPLHGTTDICGIRVTTGRNGHAPGGIWIHLAIDGGLLYMGDCSVESIVYAYDAPPPAETIIIDASYGAYDTALGDVLPEFETIFDAAPALFPVPPAGRGPDIALHLMRSGRAAPYIDEPMHAALQRLTGTASAAVRSEALQGLVRLTRESPPIKSAAGVMLAGAADANGGESARLVAQWEALSTPRIVFTGYLPPGTAAERLTQSGRAQYKRWNVHPRLSDNARLVRETHARTVLPAFGDARHEIEWSPAFAPARIVMQGSVTL
jgi:Cft2 family RNA processing exonuclease